MDIHTHYGFFYTLQGFYPRGIILRAPRPLSKEDCEQYHSRHSLPETRGDYEQHNPKYNSTIDVCLCQAFFDFSKHYYCDISRNMEILFYRWKYGNVFLSNVFRFLRALTKRLIYSRLFAPPCRSKAKLGTCHSLASIYDQASPKLANNVILSAAKDDRAVLPCALWPTRAHVWLRLMPITSDTKGSYESCSCLLLQRIPPNIKVA